MRDLPLHERKPKKRIEEDPVARERTAASFPVPDGSLEFKEGYRECAGMFALHSPNRRGVARILDEHCIILEQACMREMTRKNVARYEGFRQALKDLRRTKRVR